jgi:choline dehydrogenase-like flavoprotein
MITDGRTLEHGTKIQSDVCIVGAGPAGIAMAREFSDCGAFVCVLESGGISMDASVQELNRGIDSGTISRQDHLFDSRNRVFGGTTASWGGWCRPLDAIDFEARSWVPHSGWPFQKSHVDPFYTRAAEVFDIEPFDPGSVEGLKPPGRFVFGRDTPVATKIFQISQTYLGKFAKRHSSELEASENVHVFLHSTVTELVTHDAGDVVSRIEVACLDGNRYAVEAKYIILAMGGIENARLLLLSNRVQSAGLGNDYDIVGRYYMEHTWIDGAGSLVFLDARSLYEDYGRWSFPALSIDADLQRNAKLLNFRVGLEGRDVTHSADTKAVGKAIARLHRPRAYRNPDFPRYYRLDVSAEQAPNPESRVTLADTRDALGNRQARLTWKLSETDWVTIRRSLMIVARQMGVERLGRIQITFDESDAWPEQTNGAHHHMGATRMHVDRKQGVVDENCRVHGIANLFVSGSSVFPTVGFANPTLTIVALALRLADHVKTLLSIRT